VRGKHLLDRSESTASKLARNRVCAVKIRIDHAHQSDRFALPFQLLVDSGVIAPEDPHPHYRNGDRIFGLQEGFLGWLVATRNNKL